MGKLLGFIFSARGPIVTLVIVAVWLWRRPASRAARRFAGLSAISYLLASLTIVPYAISWVWTTGYHQLRAEEVPAGNKAIVLLGAGDQFVQGWTDSLMVTMPIEAERVLEAARVFRAISPAWVISSGGRPDFDDPGESSAVTMRDELVRLGVPRDRIVLEAASRNTHEEAVLVAPMLKSLAIDQVVLVTSGTHMRRSLGAFRAVGITAIPAIARGGDPPADRRDWLPATEALEWTGSVAHEIGGVPYYWLRGWWRR